MFNLNEFRAAMARSGFTQKKLAELLDLNEATITRKIQRGGDFSRSEINTMIEAMGIEDPERIFFARELA